MENRHQKFWLLSAFLIVLIAVFHYLGEFYYLYWRLSWYDKVVHFTGGAFIALTCISLGLSVSWKRLLPILLCLILIIGVFWEYFELRTGITSFSEPHYYLSSAYDILFAVIGGLIGIYYAKRKNS